jgi:hypothetical protein
MKKLLITSILVAATFITSTANANNYIDQATEQDLVKVCEALQSNSKIKLLRVIKRSGLSFNNIAKGLVCNGQDAIKFALLNGADKTANMLAKKGSVDLENYVAKL